MGVLDGKVAFITGLARGQGRSHAVRLAEEGASIIGIDACGALPSVIYAPASEEDLAETVRQVEDRDQRIVARVGDVRSLSRVSEVLEEGVAEFGRLDIVLANAGTLPTMGPEGQDVASFYDAVETNLTGVFNTIHAAQPHLISSGDGGAVVITSSTAGLKGITEGGPGSIGYAAAKHGVVGLMRCYANLLAPHSIRVNTIHPTGVNTPMVINPEFEAYLAEHHEMTKNLQNALPKPLIDPSDVSDAVVWLCSDAARYVTGVTFPVDAGFMVR